MNETDEYQARIDALIDALLEITGNVSMYDNMALLEAAKLEIVLASYKPEPITV